MNILLLLSLPLLIGLICMRCWYFIEAHKLALKWQQLASHAETEPAIFDPDMVARLPSPARRFFLFTIKPGTPLRKMAQIWMTGELAIGCQSKPNYQLMAAHQLLTLPQGFIWKARIGEGLSTVFGSDGFLQGKSWTNFWLFAYLPIIHIFADNDHARASFGRMLAEAACWTPAALLPDNGVHWKALNPNQARATCSFDKFTQSIDIRVAADGRPLSVSLLRWTNANPNKTYQLQPFGAYLSRFEKFEGFRLPTHVEAGNFFGGDDYFPFYKADIEGLRFVKKPKTVYQSH